MQEKIWNNIGSSAIGKAIADPLGALNMEEWRMEHVNEKYVYLQLSSIWTIFIKKIIQCVLLMCGFAAAAVVFVGSVVKSTTFPYYPQIIYIHVYFEIAGI